MVLYLVTAMELEWHEEGRSWFFAIHSREFYLRLIWCWLEICSKYPDAREMATESSKINTGYWLIYSEG